MDLARLRAAGLYDPDAPTASDRLALLQYLDERGATVEQMVEADAEGLLYALSSYLAAFAPAERIGLAEVAERFRQARRVLNHIADRCLFPQGNPWFAPPAR